MDHSAGVLGEGELRDTRGRHLPCRQAADRRLSVLAAEDSLRLVCCEDGGGVWGPAAGRCVCSRQGGRGCPHLRPVLCPQRGPGSHPSPPPPLLKMLLASAPIRPWPHSEAGGYCRAGLGLPSGTRCACVRADTDMFAEKVWLKICCETKVHPWEQFSYDANKQWGGPWRNASRARWLPLQPLQ